MDIDQLHAAGFIDRYSELHHYTTLAGLIGIVRSQSLWATRYDYLNDSTEIVALKEPLISALAKKVLPEVRRVKAFRAKTGKRVEQFGGLNIVSSQLARDFVNALYKTLLETPPFITSFCSHHDDKAYQKENGLLSQWRGYGGQGGFCLVFDTAGIVALLNEEKQRHYWVQMHIAEASYSAAETRIVDFIEAVSGDSSRMIRDILRSKDTPMSPQSFVSFLGAATLLKHEGFEEEREVRIVAVPATAGLLANMIAEEPSFRAPPIKAVERLVGDVLRPHISLFGIGDMKLPIKRIIVGPSRNQDANAKAAFDILGNAVRIEMSKTPLIDRG